MLVLYTIKGEGEPPFCCAECGKRMERFVSIEIDGGSIDLCAECLRAAVALVEAP